MRRFVTLLLIAAAAAACAANPRGTAGADPNRISEQEIRESTAANAYDLIQRARPRWLQQRPERSTHLTTAILVYQDGSRLGEVDVLRTIPLEMIETIRVLDAAQAGQLPGLGSQHVERVIQITSRGRGR